MNLWGFVRNNSQFKNLSQEQIDAMKAKTGLQHLTVINQSHQQYLPKETYQIYMSISPPSVKVMQRITWHA